jgi:hypothetical protein
VPPPPQMAPPHGLGAYMPERQPPQQVLLHNVALLDVMGISRHCSGTTAMRPSRTTVLYPTCAYFQTGWLDPQAPQRPQQQIHNAVVSDCGGVIASTNPHLAYLVRQHGHQALRSG